MAAAPTVSVAPTGWPAELELRFTRRAEGTLLTRNRHCGPLQVQKPLYPEGREICHVAILHPPGGIAAGDSLRVEASLEEGSAAVLTTPGATKWYRSEREPASQQLRFAVAAEAILEWLPRENILFDGSIVQMGLDVDLSSNAGYFGWDILSFGRRASGESWRRGRLRLRTAVRRDGRLLWQEMANIDAQSGFAQAAVGLAGCTVCGTLVMAGTSVAAGLVHACRELGTPENCRVGITQMPDVLLARYLGDSTEDAFRWFTNLWSLMRPGMAGRPACPPRVWAC